MSCWQHFVSQKDATSTLLPFFNLPELSVQEEERYLIEQLVKYEPESRKEKSFLKSFPANSRFLQALLNLSKETNNADCIRIFRYQQSLVEKFVQSKLSNQSFVVSTENFFDTNNPNYFADLFCLKVLALRGADQFTTLFEKSVFAPAKLPPNFVFDYLIPYWKKIDHNKAVLQIHLFFEQAAQYLPPTGKFNTMHIHHLLDFLENTFADSRDKLLLTDLTASFSPPSPWQNRLARTVYKIKQRKFKSFAYSYQK